MIDGVEGESDCVGDLHGDLRLELSLYEFHDLIAKTPLLSSMSPEVLQSVVQVLESQLYIPSETILTYGQRSDNLYFILRGKCEVAKLADMLPR